MKILIPIALFLLIILGVSCNEETPSDAPKLFIKYTFDSTQDRLDAFGNPVTVLAGNAAQSPNFKGLGVHSIELIQTINTFPTNNTIIYTGKETMAGGSNAIDFEQERIVANGETLIAIPLSDIDPGSYNFLRNSLAYQEYEIDILYNDTTLGSLDLKATVGSFIGFNNYITSYGLAAISNYFENKSQGFFQVAITNPITYSIDGQAPVTTVPNPLVNSPIPAGSCLVTGAFNSPLVITGNETENITIEISVSTNNSFEWQEVNMDGKYEPLNGETVVDMGVRGMEIQII